MERGEHAAHIKQLSFDMSGGHDLLDLSDVITLNTLPISPPVAPTYRREPPVWDQTEQQKRQAVMSSSVSLRSPSPLYSSSTTTSSSPSPSTRAPASDVSSLSKGKPTKRETLEDIARRVPLSFMRRYFDVPLRTAAASLDVSVTTLKRLCRRNGVTRWPHRQIQGINRAINLLQNRLKSVEPGCTVIPSLVEGSADDTVEEMKEQLHQLKHRRKEIIKASAGLKAVLGWLEDESGELLEDNSPPPPILEPVSQPSSSSSSSSSSTIFGGSKVKKSASAIKLSAPKWHSSLMRSSSHGAPDAALWHAHLAAVDDEGPSLMGHSSSLSHLRKRSPSEDSSIFTDAASDWSSPSPAIAADSTAPWKVPHLQQNHSSSTDSATSDSARTSASDSFTHVDDLGFNIDANMLKDMLLMWNVDVEEQLM